MACEDLRHVCGKCGFCWPERSAYDELTFENVRLRDELAAERARADALVVASRPIQEMVEREFAPTHGMERDAFGAAIDGILAARRA